MSQYCVEIHMLCTEGPKQRRSGRLSAAEICQREVVIEVGTLRACIHQHIQYKVTLIKGSLDICSPHSDNLLHRQVPTRSLRSR